MNLAAVKDLCKKYTNLTEEDIKILETMALQIPHTAQLTETDIFIDAPLKDGMDAVVLAWAPPEKRSLYNHSVVGELALATSEPAVYQTLKTGETCRNVRGVSQEGIPIAQTVVAIRNPANDVIGTLIMERDISEELRQEEQVEFLTQTAERLSNTLMYLSMTGSQFENWVGNGIFVLNKHSKITYVNQKAAKIFQEYHGFEALGQDFLFTMFNCTSLQELLDMLENPVEFCILNKSYLFEAYPLVTYGDLSGCVISFRDITDLRKKEQELNAKSTVIREIHHRVKNNLQNVAALLRLQMRRSDLEVVKAEFSASINRIISIAMVHDVFACQNCDSVDLRELCQRILSSLLESSMSPEQCIEAHVEGQTLHLPSIQAVPLALVINELLTNSFKHGVRFLEKGLIILSITEKRGTITLTVRDNGPDPDRPFDQVKQKRLGLQIVDSLVRDQLGGESKMERIEGMTIVTVSFPKHSSEGQL
ncbi:sensor histidine kinase [Desulfosporosinus sp. BICA1-9]|uniref:sensor histidine kinase n=1 Tax=Desulfosporosinus sp. BICA1-9 TaxID=1531958 RepID=UPI00054B006E|nr:PAS domain-containing sensor histidine kinase [Desulfosporosinus sp. BICA1-9]KJS49296.1 MAG: histidine kinase [Peptococcaceae bacterium BRH_c23]KJS81205.1 MAG: histidine kinase [Desulfosporosinus sp. BICA1-9]HBW37524.1 histidine kinase [Desulfosporosinus sp.]